MSLDYPCEGDARDADALRRTGSVMGELGDEHMSGEKIPSNIADEDEYKEWLRRAEDIFIERNSARASAFRKAGWKGQLVEMRKKLDRLWAAWQMDRALTEKDRDEALDLINAAVFFLILANEDDSDGDWPWP